MEVGTGKAQKVGMRERCIHVKYVSDSTLVFSLPTDCEISGYVRDKEKKRGSVLPYLI